jgi:diguanylate cyclase (GGDEF)-like protein
MAALAASGDVAYAWDISTDRIAWFGDAPSVLGLPAGQRVDTGDQLNIRVSPEDLPARLQALADRGTAADRFDCEYRVRAADGELRWIHDRGRVAFGDDGRPARVTGVLRVVTERKLSQVRLEYRASYDEVTGHYNAGRLSELLEHAIAQEERHGGCGAYLLLAITNLSVIAETFGRPTADAIAVAIGQRLDRNLRLTDHVGRIDGDRFGIVLRNCDEAGATEVARKIVAAAERTPVVTADGVIGVAAAIGVTTFPGVGPTVEDVMQQAEQAVADARRRHDDHFAMHRSAEPQLAHHRRLLAMGEELMAALRGKRAHFAYDPVVGRDGCAPVFNECLLRIADSSGSVRPPGAYVEAAERLGLVRLVDRHGLELASDALIRHPELHLSLNISGRTVSDRAWLRALLASVRSKPEIARRLILEITETAALRDIEETTRFIATVRDLGCRVALDDFGSGFTSFHNLKALNIDIVKIDGMFVENLTRDRQKLLFVRALLGLAEAFQFLTVAEGVGDREQAELLWDEGVDLLQGDYVVSTAVAPAWFAESLIGSGSRGVPRFDAAGR